MASLLFNKTAVISIGIVGLSVPLFLFLKSRFSQSEDDDDDNLNIEETMFFSDEGITCRDHFKNGKNGMKISELCSSSSCPFKYLK